MRRLVAPAAILFLAAVSLVACDGDTDAKLLPGTTAAEITENLELVKRYAEEGECEGASDAAAEIAAQIEALQGVDPKLKEALQRGSEKLDEVVADCEEPAPETTTTEAEITKPEHDEPQEQEKKAEKEREKEEKALEKEEEKEEKEVPPAEVPPTPPSESGGTGAPGGVSPGEPAAPEGGD